MEEFIICPNCGHKFPITEVVLGEFAEKIKSETEERYKNIIREYENKKKVLDDKEKSLIEREIRFNQELNKQLEEKLQLERKSIEEELRKKLQDEKTLETEELRSSLDKYKKMVEEYVKKLMESESKITELTIKNQENAYKIQAEFNKRLQEELERKNKENEQKEKEYKYKIQELQEQIERLNQKAQFDSQKISGEIQEIILEETLKNEFHEDIIEPVPGGKKGADVIQSVSYRGAIVGKIIWESKRTQKFENKWIEKLKEDQRSSSADIAVLVTTAMPKERSKFIVESNVIITEFAYVIPLTVILRKQLIDIFSLKNSYDSKNEIKDLLFEYVNSNEFSQNIERVLETLMRLRRQIDNEKAYMEKTWKEREQLLINSLQGMSGLFGRVQALVPSLPDLKMFGLPEGSTQKKLD